MVRLLGAQQRGTSSWLPPCPGFPWSGAILLVGLLVSGPGLALPLVLPESGRSAEATAVRAEGGGLRLAHGQLGTLEIGLRIPPGFTVYRDMIRVGVPEPQGLRLGDAVMPAGRKVPDPASDPALGPPAMREVYEHDVAIGLPLLAAPPVGTFVIPVDLRFQACRGSVCLFPQTERVLAVLQVAEPQPGQ